MKKMNILVSVLALSLLASCSNTNNSPIKSVEITKDSTLVEELEQKRLAHNTNEGKSYHRLYTASSIR